MAAPALAMEGRGLQAAAPVAEATPGCPRSCRSSEHCPTHKSRTAPRGIRRHRSLLGPARCMIRNSRWMSKMKIGQHVLICRPNQMA
eukprot:2992690-Pleurochrysis_carterae.AAC.1